MTKLIKKFYAAEIRWELDGETLECVIRKLQNLIEVHGESSMLDISGDDVEITLLVDREETDEEYSKRLQQEGWNKESKEAIERAQYEALKAKFGE